MTRILFVAAAVLLLWPSAVHAAGSTPSCTLHVDDNPNYIVETITGLTPSANYLGWLWESTGVTYTIPVPAGSSSADMYFPAVSYGGLYGGSHIGSYIGGEDLVKGGHSAIVGNSCTLAVTS